MPRLAVKSPLARSADPHRHPATVTAHDPGQRRAATRPHPHRTCPSRRDAAVAALCPSADNPAVPPHGRAGVS